MLQPGGAATSAVVTDGRTQTRGAEDGGGGKGRKVSEVG